MHEVCYQRIEEQLCKAIRANSSTLSEVEMCKAIFDTSRSGKFDMIRDHRSLTCSCKIGRLRAVTEGRKIIRTGIQEATDEKKRRKKKTIVQRVAQKQLFLDDDRAEELDDEQALYVYHRKTVENEQHLDLTPLTLDDVNDTSFPELPPNGLPPPRHAVRQQLCKTQNFDFRIHDRGSFHTLSLSSAGSDKWKPKVIGKRGSTLRTFIATQKKLGNNIDRIYIENDQHDLTRIIINGKHADERECCAHALQFMIQGIMV